MSPPQFDHGSPPVLVDDAMREIFLRIPPDDPATLARATAVCTTWYGIISDADFDREYRKFHGAPPVLGFLHNCWNHSTAHFVSTAATFHERHLDWYALDSRHGLVLFNTNNPMIGDFAVCDLVTHDQWIVPSHPTPDLWDVNYWWNAAVLCARLDRCDHRDCSEGAFLVALVGFNSRAIHASVYSSEAREWSATISMEEQIGHYIHPLWTRHSAVVGNKVYFPAPYGCTNLIVEYDLGVQQLAVIRVAFASKPGAVLRPKPGTVLEGAEDGMLMYALVKESELHLWSMEPGFNGATRCRVIDLEPLLPHIVFDSIVSVAGFAECAGVIFLGTDEGLFTVELCSCRSKKVHWNGFVDYKVIPYESFYTGGHGERGRRALVGGARRWAGLLWLYGDNLQ